MLKKLCLRDIRTTLGRFLAIAAIIALGVGLFAGLRVSKTAMLVTGGQYLQDLHLFDFRLLSTLGFTDEDVEAIGALEGVEAVSGSIFEDALYETRDGSDSVMAFHSLSDRVNLTDLRAGRMPESPDECVLDATNFSTDVIGTQLVLSENNDEDTLDVFAYDAYTVVGLVDSPLYINYERGSTSLGAGTVSAFGYLLPDGFDVDYYTELYLTLDESYPLYSQAYDDLIDERQPAVEALLQERADLRYEDLRSEGQETLDEAREKLDDAKQEYEDGKQEADQELADGWQELVDARQELDDGWAELEDARTTLAREQADGEQELSDGEQELNDALKELEDGEQDYLDAEQELNDGEQEYADGLREYQDGLAEYEDGKQQYEEGLAEYEDGLAEYEEGLAEYESGHDKYNTGVAQYAEGLALYEEQRALFESQVPDIEAVREQVEAYREQAEAAREPLNTLLDTIASQLPEELGISDREQLVTALRDDPDGRITAAVNGILAMLAPLDPSVPADSAALLELCTMLEQYDQGVAALAAYEQLEQTRVVLEETAERLDKANREILDAKRQLNDAKAELDEGKQQLDDTAKQLEDGWAELEDARLQLEDARQELDDGWQEYRDARVTLDDGWQEYYDGVQELADGRAELERQVADARQEIADGEQELNDGEQELNDGLLKYEDGKREAEAELADGAQKIADAEEELSDGEQELAELEPADCYTLGRDTNIGYVCYENDTDIVASVSGVFPLFFFLVAALVCITTMTRMVEDERTRIGVLKALGYSNGAIMSKYLIYAGAASLLGCALGFFAGSWIFPEVMWRVYDIMYSFSYPIAFVLDWQLAAFSIGLYLFCALGSTWLVCRSSLRETAADLIRPKAPKSGKRILLERLPFLWRRLSFLYKVSARNIFRYKKRLFMMLLGIGGCTALLLTGFGISDSIANVVDFQYDEISLYDSAVTFQDPMDAAAQEAFLDDCADWISDAVFFHGSTVDVSAGGTTKSSNLVAGTSELTRFLDFHSGQDAVAFPGDGAAIINNGLADALDLEVGDTLTIRDSDMNAMEVTVSGIFDNYIYNYVVLTPETYEAGLGTAPEIKSAYVIDREGVETHAAAAAMIDYDGVASVSVNADMRNRINSMLESLNYIVLLVIFCAGSLAFIVLYNLTNINITERIREIATIKVLGFYPGETAAYVFRENVVLSAIGALAGLVLGRLLHAYVMYHIRVDMMHFDVRIAGFSYVLAFLLTLVFTAVVNLVMFFKLQRINMAESLKSIE